MNKTLIVCAAQQSFTQDIVSNRLVTTNMIEQAAAQKVDIIVLPELHNGPYFCQNEDIENFRLAECIPGPTTQFYSALAKKLGIIIITSIFEKRAPGLYHNTSAVIDKDGSIAGIYRKMHIPDDPGFYEKFYFTPGDLGFQTINTSLGKLGVLICWDQWFPEAARLMSLQGAQLLIYPTAIGWDPADTEAEQQKQLQSWLTIQRGHAIANGIPVISCNRTGLETAPSTDGSGINFWGNSFICGPQGEILVQAGQKENKLLICHLNSRHSEKTRQIWPFFRDRRIDFYGQLNQRYLD